MPHCDPEVLSLVALGEQVDESDSLHVSGCPECRRDVDRLRDVVAALRVDDLGLDLSEADAVQPPPSVWAGIAAATGVSTAPRTDRMPRRPDREGVAERPPAPGPAPTAAPAPGARPAPVPASMSEPAARDRTGQQARSGRQGTPRSERRPWRQQRGARPNRGLLLAVAASTLLLGAAGGSAVTYQLTRPDPQPQALVLHQATLGPLPPAPKATGKAAVIETPDGPRLRVEVTDIQPLQGEFYEVWLIDTSVKRMVPVGILRGTSGSFAIPAGLDVLQYPVVDISIEAPGDPTHSGKSVLRGVIQT